MAKHCQVWSQLFLKSCVRKSYACKKAYIHFKAQYSIDADRCRFCSCSSDGCMLWKNRKFSISVHCNIYSPLQLVSTGLKEKFQDALAQAILCDFMRSTLRAFWLKPAKLWQIWLQKCSRWLSLQRVSRFEVSEIRIDNPSNQDWILSMRKARGGLDVVI